MAAYDKAQTLQKSFSKIMKQINNKGVVKPNLWHRLCNEVLSNLLCGTDFPVGFRYNLLYGKSVYHLFMAELFPRITSYSARLDSKL